MALTSSPLLSSSLFCSPLSFSPLSPVFFLPKWPSESLMIQRDCVSIGRCVSCLVTLKINHLATLSQSVTFLCFPGTDCSKSTGPLGEMRAGKGVRWSGQSPSKLAIRLHISSESESVMPAIMPTTQHHGSCWGPMTASYGRNRFGVERWRSYVTENLPCASQALCLLDTYYVPGPVLAFASVFFQGRIRIVVEGPWPISAFRVLFLQTRNITSFSNDSVWYDGRVLGLERHSSTTVSG